MANSSRSPEMPVESLDLRDAPEATLRDIHVLEELIASEAEPDDPPRPVENYIAAVRTVPAFIDIRAFLVRGQAGDVAGVAECVLVRTNENPELAQLSVLVGPDHRRRGIARALLAACVEFAAADNRDRFIGVTSDRVPAGDAFAKRVGAVAVQSSHLNRLDLSGVDRAVMDDWIADGPVRAPGYELFAVDGPLPDAIVHEVAALLDVMNDQPRGSMDIDDRHATADELRAWEAQAATTGSLRWWIFVRRMDTGRLVGLTDVTWNPSRPRTIHQGDTGVLEEHRGHGLGKWLKAAMLSRILQDCEEAVDVRTGNADSNAAMLGINRLLGFRPYLAQTTWKADLRALQDYLHADG